jgi:2-isopropylmalate synthase
MNVQFLDTTLRDGIKLPFVALGVAERLLFAKQLAALGVDIIDAGYPASSREEKEGVSRVVEEVHGPYISALSRTTVEDVGEVCRLLRSCEKPYLHVFLPCSDQFLRNVLKRGSQECLTLIRDCLGTARECLQSAAAARVQFSLGEVGEADRGFLAEAAAAAAEAGAQVVNLADTHGCLHPGQISEVVGVVRGALSRSPDVLVGMHCHNDLGLATANTLAGLEAGARHVEGTITGIGGRSGNTAIEEVAFAIEVFRERLGLDHNLHLDQLARTTHLLARLTGIQIHPNKAVVGKCAFEEARGGELHGHLQGRVQELLRDGTIGRVSDVLFAEQELSMAGFRQQLDALGIDSGRVNLDKVYRLFLSQVRRKKNVSTSEIQAMVEDTRLEAQPIYELVSFNVMTGSHSQPVGSVELSKGSSTLVQSSHGSGPVDALCRAVDKAIGIRPRLVQYSVDLLSEGKDARTEVTVSLAFMGRSFHGHSGSTDVIEASLLAYLDAMNTIEAHRARVPVDEEFYIDGEQLWWE